MQDLKLELRRVVDYKRVWCLTLRHRAAFSVAFSLKFTVVAACVRCQLLERHALLARCDGELVRFFVHADANLAMDGHLRVGAVEHAIAVVEAVSPTPDVPVVRPHAVVVSR